MRRVRNFDVKAEFQVTEALVVDICLCLEAAAMATWLSERQEGA